MPSTALVSSQSIGRSCSSRPRRYAASSSPSPLRSRRYAPRRSDQEYGPGCSVRIEQRDRGVGVLDRPVEIAVVPQPCCGGMRARGELRGRARARARRGRGGSRPRARPRTRARSRGRAGAPRAGRRAPTVASKAASAARDAAESPASRRWWARASVRRARRLVRSCRESRRSASRASCAAAAEAPRAAVCVAAASSAAATASSGPSGGEREVPCALSPGRPRCFDQPAMASRRSLGDADS